jgi:hypothetical protein
VNSHQSPELCLQKARDCLALAQTVADPKQKAAMLRLAEWWMRIAEYADSRADPPNVPW